MSSLMPYAEVNTRWTVNKMDSFKEKHGTVEERFCITQLSAVILFEDQINLKHLENAIINSLANTFGVLPAHIFNNQFSFVTGKKFFI